MIVVIKNVKKSILDNKYLMLKVMILFILKTIFYIEQTINCYIDKVNKFWRIIKINIKIFNIQKKLLKIVIKFKKIKKI